MLETTARNQVVMQFDGRGPGLLERAFRDCEHRLGRPATNLEVCDELGMSLQELYSRLDDHRGVSIGRVDDCAGETGSEDSEPMVKYLPDPDNEGCFSVYSRTRFQAAMTQALESLPRNEKLVVSLFHNEDLTMRDIAQIFGVSEARIAQIHTTAMLRIRGKLLSLDTAVS